MAYRFTSAPLTPDTWDDLEALAERRGSTVLRSCWCMFYRVTGDFGLTVAAGPEHREDLRRVVDDGESPGLVGYVDGGAGGVDQPRSASGVPAARRIADDARRGRHPRLVDRVLVRRQ